MSAPPATRAGRGLMLAAISALTLALVTGVAGVALYATGSPYQGDGYHHQESGPAGTDPVIDTYTMSPAEERRENSVYPCLCSGAAGLLGLVCGAIALAMRERARDRA